MEKIAAIFDVIGSVFDALLGFNGSRSRDRSGGVITLLPPLPVPPVKASARQAR